jgi:diguanylate cyclase
MVSETTLLILGGCILGAIQLIAGIAIGLWLRRPGSDEANRGMQSMIQASLAAERLKLVTDELSTSAHEHRSQLEQATELLNSGTSRRGGELAELVVHVINDIVRANQSLQSQLESAEQRLEKQALEIEAHISRSLTDSLTGLPNRRAFNERLEERMSAWNRRQEQFSLLMLDVDHFKKFNDEHGHLAGDQVLSVVGRTIRGAVRLEDAVARYGGEEFAVLLPNTTLEQAAVVAEKIRHAVAAAVVEHNDQKFAVTISGGMATIIPGDTTHSLIHNADVALYAAKEAGRNQVCAHTGDCAESARPISRLVELIQAADTDRHHATIGDAQPVGFGAFLPHEAISTDLAKKCDELRRLVEDRGQAAI